MNKDLNKIEEETVRHYDFLDCDDFEALGEWDTRACCKNCHYIGDDAMTELEHSSSKEQALVCCFLATKLQNHGH